MTRSKGGLWLVAAAVVVVGMVVVWGWQSGSCASTVGDGADVDCSSGPAVGTAAAWVLTTGAVIFVVYALSRALRAPKG